MKKKDFRFYDSRQKYLLFVTTTNEKNNVADEIHKHLKKLRPRLDSFKVMENIHL